MALVLMMSFQTLDVQANTKGKGKGKQEVTSNKNDKQTGLYELKIKGNNKGDISIDTGNYSEGEEILFTTTPKDGYIVDKINVSHGDVEKLSENSYKFIMPAKKVSMTVVFKKGDKATDSIDGNATDSNELDNTDNEIDTVDEVEYEETKFIDTSGNEYNIVSLEDVNIYEDKEIELDQLIDLSKATPMNEHPIIIETENPYIKGSIQIEDETYVPSIILNVTDDHIELVPFYYDTETKSLTYTLMGETTYRLIPLQTITEQNFKARREITETQAKMFNILENENGKVKISLDYIRDTDIMLGDTKLTFDNAYYNIRKLEQNKVSIIENKSVKDTNYIIEHDLGQGVYEVAIYSEEKFFIEDTLGSADPNDDIEDYSYYQDKDVIVWEQDIFAQDKPTLSNTEVDELANKYAPIVAFNENEEYFPISFETLFNTKEDINNIYFGDSTSHPANGKEIKFETLFGGNNLAYNDLATFMSYNGNKNYVLHGNAPIALGGSNDSGKGLENVTGDINNSTVYYSYIEDRDRFYINYHFIYAFDPKSRDMEMLGIEMFSHNYDRESMTIEFYKSTKKPLNVVYSGHLKGQELGLINNDLNWDEGAVKINYDNIVSYDNHPVVAVAQGAHAIYPIGGKYYVTSDSQLEPAGFSESFKPYDFEENFIDKKVITPYDDNKYNLRRIELDEVSNKKSTYDGIDGKNPWLSFSGNWVDVFYVNNEGTQPFFEGFNAKFLPFTTKERNVKEYVGNSSEVWDWNKVDYKSLRDTSLFITKNMSDKTFNNILDNNIIEVEIVYLVDMVGSQSINVAFNSFNKFGYNFVEIERLVNTLGGTANYIDEDSIKISTILGDDFIMNEGDALNFYKHIRGIENMKVIKLENGKLYAPIREIVYLYNKALDGSDYMINIGWNNDTKKISITLSNYAVIKPTN